MEKLLEACKKQKDTYIEAENKYFDSAVELLKKYLIDNDLEYLEFEKLTRPVYWNEWEAEWDDYYAAKIENDILVLTKSEYFYDDDWDNDEEYPWTDEWKLDMMVDKKDIADSIIMEIESRMNDNDE